LHPKLLMLLNKSSKPFPRGLYLDLATTRENATGKKLNIIKSLEPGSHGINPLKIDIAMKDYNEKRQEKFKKIAAEETP
jgi:hypothetical protein